MEVKIIKKEHLVPSIWDGGRTFEYYIYPEDALYSSRDFDFRISHATIEKVPSNFTRFEEFSRYLIMIDNTLEIVHNGKKEHYRQHEIFPFPSSDFIQSFSLGNDFNLMVKKGNEAAVIQTCEELTTASTFIFIFNPGKRTNVSVNEESVSLDSMDLLYLKNDKNKNVLIRDLEGCITIQIDL